MLVNTVKITMPFVLIYVITSCETTSRKESNIVCQLKKLSL